MKRFLLILTSFGLITSVSAQDILDGAYKKDIRDGGKDRLEQKYHHVREADVMWSTKIWREIDLREKINQVFYYPVQRIDDRRSLIDVLMDAINEGTITAYGNAYKDDEFKSPMTPAEIKEIGVSGNLVDTVDFYDEDREEEVFELIYNTFDPSTVTRYRVKEEWYFDKQRSVMDVRIIGLCPIRDRFDEDSNEFLGVEPLFWVYFPEARKVLTKAEVFNHRKNNAARLTFDDIFHKRFFNSYIVKESNKYDRFVNQYKTGLDALLESERIKEEIFHLEHDLWEY
ncbi:MAG: gliding motility protein GldN [Flavobacteriales bacterium]|nr:gliding motility protein GldN [Flavobacteriales bacterium]|tara:strand:+ start:96 stop:950 length:855 start_codon:yes stop_codon:yes gene_type:complete